MSTKPKREERAEQEEETGRRKAEGGLLAAIIREAVMESLGEPANLLRAEARLLWENYYRVNVFVGRDVASARVAHSFFVSSDGNGKVLDSTPPITRRY